MRGVSAALRFACLFATACAPGPRGDEILQSTSVEPSNHAGSGSGSAAQQAPPVPALPVTKVLPPAAEPPPASPAALPAGPLNEAQRAPLLAIRNDPPPPATTRNTHYWVSNEGAHHLWRERISDLGGALVGVGTDQLYLMAGWQQPELLIPMDFDIEIVKVHRLYGIAFANAATPQAFMDLWNRKPTGTPPLAAFVETDVQDPTLRKELLRSLRTANIVIHARLRQLVRLYAPRQVACFINDQTQYDRVRNLWLEQRVFPVRGDLTADTTMQDIAAALRKVGTPLRALYLSNAEQYFPYGERFRRNIMVQPFDDRSLVLRGYPSTAYRQIEGDEYHYSHQPALNFVQLMQVSSIASVQQLMRTSVNTEPFGTSIVNPDPTPAKRAPKIAPMRDAVEGSGR